MKASVTTKIKNHNNQNYVAQFSTSNSFGTVISTPQEQPDNFSLINFSVNDLLENTRYYVRIVDSLLNPIDSYVGSFKTPANSAHSFKFGFASCSWSDSTSASNQRIYDNIANKALSNELDFFFHLGDMHYRDISINDESLFQDAFDDVFAAPRQNNCWKNLSMYYMWDDHDYGQNDTDKNSPSRNAATDAFRRRVPSPPLANNLTNGAVYYSFVRGRVRFIVTDLRSEREPKGAFPSSDPLQKPFSDTQKEWFFDELLAAKDSEQIMVWINTKPWISATQNGKDDWGGYHAARLEIADFIETNGLRDSIVMLSGDMHALAYDDGSSSNNFGDLKVCHAAPLDQESRAKGGPYTLGPITEDSGTGWSTQYGIIEVTDNEDDFINIKFKGIAISKIDFTESTVIDIDFNLKAAEGIPDEPTLPTASNITNNGFTVSWSAVTGATSYTLEYSTAEDFSGLQTIPSANNAGQAITGLTAGTTYYVRVKALNIAGTSAPSPTLVQITALVAPSILTPISVSVTAFVLEWNAVTGATSYILEVATVPDLGFNSSIIRTVNPAINTGQSITGLTAGTTYYVRVRAVNSAGEGPNSSTFTQQTIPVEPNAPTSTNVSTTGFTVSWSAVTGAANYTLEYSTAQDFSGLQTIPSANNAGQAITGLTAGTTYYVRVKAINSSGGASAPSPSLVQITVPGIPNTPTLTNVSPTGFTANWGAVTGAQSYRIDVSTVSNFGSFVSGYNNLTVSALTQSITGLTAATTYYVRVRAVNSAGTSASSQFAQQQTPTVITIPVAPNAPTSTNVFTTGFTANWSAVTSAQSYRIDVSTVSNFGSFVSGYNDLTVSALTQSITGLTAGTTYYVRVRAVNSAGTSASSSTLTQITALAAPNAPTSTNVSTTGFTANWGAVTGAVNYRIDVSATPSFGSFIVGYNNLTVSALTQSITGLTAGTTYYVRVRAVNSTGTSASSPTLTQITVPSAPNTPTLTNVSTGGFTASWNTVAGANSYTLEYSISETFSNPQTIPSANIAGQAVTGLNSGTIYYVRVRAVNSAGTSAPSQFAQQQTLTESNPFYYDGLAIYLGNENAVTDDDININIQQPGPITSPLTYVTAGQYVDNIGGCDGAENCEFNTVTLNFPCYYVDELKVVPSERPASFSILSLSDFKNTVDNFESIIKDPNVENYILETFANKEDSVVRMLADPGEICPVDFCAACTGVVVVPQTAGAIGNLEATKEWDTWFLNSKVQNTASLGSFSCNGSGVMNLDLQFSPQLLPNYLSGIPSTGISIQYRSYIQNPCNNWGAYKVYAIKYLDEAVSYKSNTFLNFEQVLLASGFYVGPSAPDQLLADFIVPNVFRMIESEVTFRVDMTIAIRDEELFLDTADKVSVAGSFNGFDYFEYYLERVSETNIFQTTIPLVGSNLQRFEYRFAVVYENGSDLATVLENNDRRFLFREGSQVLNTFCWKNSRTDCPTENIIVTSFVGSNPSLSRYIINGVSNNPPITLVRGNTYQFNLESIGNQNFWIKTVPTTGTNNGYSPILRNGLNGTNTFEFTPNRNAPNTLYYISQNNIAMSGIINIVNPS